MPDEALSIMSLDEHRGEGASPRRRTGDDDDDGATRSLLLCLVRDWTNLFDAHVGSVLGAKDHVALAGLNREHREAMKKLEAVEWLLGRGEVWGASEVMEEEQHQQQHQQRGRRSVCSRAALEGRLQVLKWAREHGCEWGDNTCASAASSGRLEVLKWLREHGCPWNSSTCERAAEGGHLEVLKWAREHGCPWSMWQSSELVAERGHLQVLKLAIEGYGCPVTSRIEVGAAKGGHLEVLKWLRERGHPISIGCCARAADKGHLEVLKWAHTMIVEGGDVVSVGANRIPGEYFWDRDCAWDRTMVIEAARARGHTHVLEWALTTASFTTASFTPTSLFTE